MTFEGYAHCDFDFGIVDVVTATTTQTVGLMATCLAFLARSRVVASPYLLGTLAGAAITGGMFYLTQGAEVPSPSGHFHQSPDPENSSEPNEPGDNVPICGICYEPFHQIKRANVRTYATTCGHVFCHNCILELKRRNMWRCGYCNAPVDWEDLRQVYI